MRKTIGLAAVLAAVIALPALAQAPAGPAHIRGQVQSLTGDTLVIAQKTGAPITVKLAPNWLLVVVKPIGVDAIQPGSFIGTTEVDTPDGSGQSLEVHVFPPGVKLGEGHYPWDLQPHSMMTNGTVGTVKAGANGRELDVAFPSGSRHIVVPADVPIVLMTFSPDHSLVKPGAGVFLIGAPQPDGTYAAANLTIGENGAPPPM
jgi:hypothetical protein